LRDGERKGAVSRGGASGPRLVAAVLDPRVVALGAAVLLAGSLGACGGDSNDSSSATTTQPTPEGTTSSRDGGGKPEGRRQRKKPGRQAEAGGNRRGSGAGAGAPDTRGHADPSSPQPPGTAGEVKQLPMDSSRGGSPVPSNLSRGRIRQLPDKHSAAAGSPAPP